MIDSNVKDLGKKIAALLEHRNIIKKRKPDFIRHKWFSIPSLGKGVKKKQKWRKPKGRHNKLREKRKGRGKQPSIGFSSPRLVRKTIGGMKPVIVKNLDDVKKIKKMKENGENVIGMLSSIGLKKKIGIAKKSIQENIDFINFTPYTFLEMVERELKERKKIREEKEKERKEIIEKGRKTREEKETKYRDKEKEIQQSQQSDKKHEEKEIIKPKQQVEKNET